MQAIDHIIIGIAMRILEFSYEKNNLPLLQESLNLLFLHIYLIVPSGFLIFGNGKLLEYLQKLQNKRFRTSYCFNAVESQLRFSAGIMSGICLIAERCCCFCKDQS
jgi:hypothetical protein